MAFLPLKAFYDEIITNEHRSGDIWNNLPTYGLLKESTLPGVVITPACDLANDKVETINYLPITSIRTYLATNCFLPEIKGVILGLSNQLNYTECRIIIDHTWPPNCHDLERMTNAISGISKDDKKKKLCDRFIFLLEHLEKIISNKLSSSDMQNLSKGLGYNNFNKLLNRIIANNYRNDIHFLPADGQNPSWSVIKEHSVIMFRYPLTAPIEIFDLAQSSLNNNWQNEIGAISANISIAELFSEFRPIKTLRIEQPFLHDMLNRFVALYARLGSPDFTINTIEKILIDLRK